MDFTLTDEQELLEESVSRWAAAVRATGAHRQVLNGKAPPIEDLWPELGRNGWLGIVTPTDCSGSGGSLVDACLLLFAMYRELVPLPFATNAVLVPAATALFGGSPDIRPQLASGERRVALGVASDLDRPGLAWAWEWSPDAAVAVIGTAGVTVVDRDVVDGTAGWDLLHPLGTAQGSGRLVDTGDNAWVGFVPVLDVVCSAVFVGLMEGALRLAVDYAKTREQFGQPIGAFQAVQHLCAEMHVDAEASRSACLGAASAVDARAPESSVVAAIAKAWCAEASIRVTETAIQVLGGIGNTWESDAHLYLRGCHQWSRLGGGAAAALDRVASELFDQGSAS